MSFPTDCMNCKYAHKECDWWCFHGDAPSVSEEGIPLDEEVVNGFVARVIPASWCPLKEADA